MLVTKKEQRFEHPTEAGVWFTLLLPLTAGDMKALPTASTLAEVKLGALQGALKAWSYDAPPTRDSIESLDVETFNFLTSVLFEPGAAEPDSTAIAVAPAKDRLA